MRTSDDVAPATQRRRARGPETAVPPRHGYIGAGGTPQTRVGGWWELHPKLLRVVAVAALVWGSAWLGYRTAFSWRGANPFAFGALVLVEGFNLLSLALLAFAGWEWHQEPAPPAAPGWSVDVFVCTYDETVEVVEATLAGCAALRYPHTTYLLDDGRREEMQTLADHWGAQWMTRPDNAHAKAGNINHALTCTDGDLIFFLDADHVPLPDALDLTVGYFSDPLVALVQSPHDFYNQDSVQHYEAGRHEQSLFFEVVCPGKDRHNASFWCGSATVVRRVPLEEVGGVATETIAEDFHTTIKMHRRGWSTRYHNQVLVQGLAPVDLDGYLLQRDRWARGNLAVFRLPESPLRRRSGLNLAQRISYFASLFAYGAGFAYLLMLGVLIAALGGGVLPARAGEIELLTLWLPATVLAVAATVALCRGHMRLGESSRYTIVSAEIFARALRCAFFPSRTKFKVTPKEGVDTGGWEAVRRLRLVLLLSAMLSAALVWRVLSLFHVVHARPLPGIATPLAIALAIWELSRIAVTVRHVARRRQRRRHFRFSCELPAVVASDGSIQTATIADLSLAGLSLEADERIEPGSSIRLVTTVATVAGPYRSISIEAIVRSCRPVGERAWRLGAEITKMDADSERELVTFCHVVYPWSQLRPDGHAPQPLSAGAITALARPQLASEQRREPERAAPRTRADALAELRREVARLDRSAGGAALAALHDEVATVERTARESSRRPEPERPRAARHEPEESKL